MAKKRTIPRLPADAWRATRRKGTAMPEDLWSSAAALARKHGITTIARGLPVEYAALKRRADRLGKGTGEAPPSPAGFVEIDTAQLVEQVMETIEIAGPVVELSRLDGTRMVIRLPGSTSLNVAELAAGFCGGRS